ncbi:AlbA family DNA-binding domain-containing protein [Kribbella sp. NPDC055110]
MVLDDLTSDHIQSLVTNSVSEEFDLDFKRELYGKADKDRRSLAGDVAALANTAGGVVILGVEENKQAVAVDAAGVALSGAEEERMRQIIGSLAAPVPTFDIIRVADSADPDHGYYVIAVPRSTRAPHGVIVGDGYRFPKRNGSTTRYLSESEIAAAYRDRFAGAEQQNRRVDQVEAEAVQRLSTSAHPWLTVTLVPELYGHMDITHSIQKAFGAEIVNTPADDMVGLQGSRFDRALVGRRRLMADGSTSGASHATWVSAEYHSDGSGAYSLWVRDLEAPDVGRLQGHDPEVQVIDDESIVAAVLTGARRLAAHARDRAAAGGDAVIRVRLTPKYPGPRYVEIGYQRGHGPFSESRSPSKGIEVPAPVETVASIDELADSGPALVSATARLVDELAQNFGIAELGQVTVEGEIRRIYWKSQMQALVLAWAASAGVRVIEGGLE